MEFLRAAQPLEAPVLQHAEQFGLQWGAHLGDLIQQQRPAIGQLELAGLGGRRARECAAFVPEQFAFQERVGNRRATDFQQRFVVAVAEKVDRVGDDLLARAALTGDQHADIGRRDLADDLFDGRQGGAVTDQSDDPALPLELPSQTNVLGGQALFGSTRWRPFSTAPRYRAVSR